MIAALVGAVIAVPKIVDAFRGRPSRRDRIRKDVELLGLLSPESDAKAKLPEFVDQEIIALIEDETEKRRDPTGIVLATALTGISVWLIVTVIAGDTSAWWLLVAVPFLLLGVVGFSQDAIPRRRDERGRPIGEGGDEGKDEGAT